VIADGIDIALRVRFPPLENNDLVMRVLAESTQRLVAAPMLLKGLSHPLVPGRSCQASKHRLGTASPAS